VMRRLKALDPDKRKAIKEWAQGRSLAPAELLRDEQWLTYVEERLDHMDAGIAT